MSYGEFEIIKKYFAVDSNQEKSLLIGNGDDAAAVLVEPGYALLTCVDTLVAGVHFPIDVPVESIGFKSLAVNISDIAAMGGEPKWATLALTIPDYDKGWLEKFSKGFFKLANKYGIKLIGGDTTRGSLTVSVQLMGVVKSDKQLLRSGAKIGDKIFVTGTLGDGGVGLDSWQGRVELGAQTEYFRGRLNFPEPQVGIGKQIRELASSAIDISDGLGSDLLHILKSSGVGARINEELIPTPNIDKKIQLPKELLDYALYSGDDYQLCFTSNPEHCADILALSDSITEIGEIITGEQLVISTKNGGEHAVNAFGYNHFA